MSARYKLTALPFLKRPLKNPFSEDTQSDPKPFVPKLLTYNFLNASHGENLSVFSILVAVKKYCDDCLSK